MEIECIDVGDGTVEVVVRGHLDISVVEELRRALLVDVLGTRPTRLEINLADVGFMDSSVLGVLVAARKRANAIGVDLVLHTPSDRVRHILEATGLDRVFPTTS